MSTVILPTSTSRVSVRSSAPAVRTRLRLTRRGRIVLTLLVAIPLVIGVALAVLDGGRATAGGAGSNGEQSSVVFQTVTIQPGETLWQLAEQKAPNSDPRDFIQDVVNLNNLQGSGVQAGEQIAIPTKYTQH
jgi:hypothetical protein